MDSPVALNGSSAGSPPTPGWRACLLVGAVAVLVHLPFLQRPFHIDEWDYVHMSVDALSAPVGAYEGERVFFNQVVDLRAQMTHPPAMAVYLGLVRTLAPLTEVTARLSVLVFPALFAIATMGIAAFAGAPVILAGLLAATCPAVMISGHSLMSDMPAAALLTAAGWASLLAWRSRRLPSVVAATAAGLLAGASTLFAFPAIAGVVWLAIAPASPRRRWLTFLAAGIGVVPFVAWNLLTWWRWGQPHLLTASRVADLLDVDLSPVEVTASLLLMAGAGVLLPGVVMPLLARPRRGSWMIAGCGALAGVALTGGVPLGARVVGAIGGACAAAAIANMAWAWRSAADDGGEAERQVARWLSLLVLMTFAGYALTAAFAALRYVLLCAGALIVIVLARHSGTGSRARAATVSLAVACGFAVGVADFQLAGVYPSFVRALQEDSGIDLRAARFAGDLGFGGYLARAGARPVLRDEKWLPETTVLLTAEWVGPGLTRVVHPELLMRLQGGEQRVADSSFPVRIYSRESGAGAYASVVGPVPFALSTAPIERFWVYRVGPDRAATKAVVGAALGDGAGFVTWRPEIRMIESAQGRRAALLIHPPASVTIPLDAILPPGSPPSTLRWGYGLDPQVWSRSVDGAFFRVETTCVATRTSGPEPPREPGGTVVGSWQAHLDPRSELGDRGWFQGSLELPEPERAPDCELRLWTESGDDSAWDWAMWSDFGLVGR